MLRFKALLLAATLGVWAVACSSVDPAPPRDVVGATPGGNGAVKLRIGSCLAGRLESLVVSVYREDGNESEADVRWRLDAQPGRGLQIASGEPVDVTIGTPPAGMVEASPLLPLPNGETVRVDITMSSQEFSFFFRPDELQDDKIQLDQTQVDASEFDDKLDGACS